MAQVQGFLEYTQNDGGFFGCAFTVLRRFPELGAQVVTSDREFWISPEDTHGAGATPTIVEVRATH